MAPHVAESVPVFLRSRGLNFWGGCSCLKLGFLPHRAILGREPQAKADVVTRIPAWVDWVTRIPAWVDYIFPRLFFCFGWFLACREHHESTAAETVPSSPAGCARCHQQKTGFLSLLLEVLSRGATRMLSGPTSPLAG